MMRPSALVLGFVLTATPVIALPIEFHVRWQVNALGEDPVGLDGASMDLYLLWDGVEPPQRCVSLGPCGGFTPQGRVVVTGSATGQDGIYAVRGIAAPTLRLSEEDGVGTRITYREMAMGSFFLTTATFATAILPSQTWLPTGDGRIVPIPWNPSDVLQWEPGIPFRASNGAEYGVSHLTGSAYQIPEPSALAFAVLGCMAAGLIRRRPPNT